MIDIDFELHMEKLCGSPTKQHPFHKDFKIFQYGRNLRINCHRQHKFLLFFINQQFCCFNRIIHTVVNIECSKVGIPNTAAANIGFIC